jgi:hypothetical protein
MYIMREEGRKEGREGGGRERGRHLAFLEPRDAHGFTRLEEGGAKTGHLGVALRHRKLKNPLAGGIARGTSHCGGNSRHRLRRR